MVRSKFSEGIRPDTVFVPFHWADSQNVNNLVSEKLDPACKMPGFKVSAVNISPSVKEAVIKMLMQKPLAKRGFYVESGKVLLVNTYILFLNPE